MHRSTVFLLTLLIGGCAAETPTPTGPIEATHPRSSYDSTNGLRYFTDQGDLIRGYVVSEEEFIFSITARSGESFAVSYRPDRVIQTAKRAGRSDVLTLIDNDGVGTALLNGTEFARSSDVELLRRPSETSGYQQSLVYDNRLGARMFEEINGPDLPQVMDRLIIGSDGNCKDSFIALLLTCIESTCFIPNPVCNGCVGAMTSCIVIAIFNDWNGGRG